MRADFHELLVHWAEITPATVVNRYSRTGSNWSKPYQAQLIAGAGFPGPGDGGGPGAAS